MSIEISPPAAHAKVASSKEHGDTKTKPGSGSAASGQPTKWAGFMAILAAADEPMPAGLTLGDGTDADSALVPPDAGVDSASASLGIGMDTAAWVPQAMQWVANPMAVPTPTTPEPEKGNNAAEGAEFRFGMMAKSSSPPIRTGMLPADAAANSVAFGAQGPASGSAAGSLRKTGKDVKDTAALQASPLANAGNPAVQAGRSDDRAFKFMAQDMGTGGVDTAAWLPYAPQAKTFLLSKLEYLEQGPGRVQYLRPTSSPDALPVVDCHSHASFPAFFSVTDVQDDKDDDLKIAFVVGSLNEEKPTIAMRLVGLGGVSIDLTEWITELL